MKRLIVAIGLLSVGLLGAELPTPGHATALRFGAGSLDRLQAGQSHVYRVEVDKSFCGPSPSGGAGTVTRYARLLVTDVTKAGDAVEAKGRLDRVDDEGKVLFKDLARFVLAAKGDRSKTKVMCSDERYSAITGLSQGIPCFIAAYPDTMSVPTDRPAPTVERNNSAGAMVSRYTASYDPKSKTIKVSVEGFRQAYEKEAAERRTISYWVRDEQKVVSSVPLGQQAAPMLVEGKGFPRDKFGIRNKDNVFPVTVNRWETQTWEPGAPFPKEVRVAAPDSGGGYVATLIRTEQVPLEPETTQPPTN